MCGMRSTFSLVPAYVCWDTTHDKRDYASTACHILPSPMEIPIGSPMAIPIGHKKTIMFTIWMIMDFKAPT